MSRLAIDGGPSVRSEPFPPRRLIAHEERAAAIAVFDAALESGNPINYNGLQEQQYEKDFTEYMGGGFADAVNSGSNALYCALGALQMDAFSEVIVPPITDPGGVMPVALLGLIPVVADADPRTYNTGADYIEPLVTERTRAVVVAHIAGEPVDMDPVMTLARNHNLAVIEDCAQAHGATYKGKRCGTIGHIAAFSTMSGKHFCTGGQGGVVFTLDAELHWRGRRFADRGKPFNVEHPVGNVVAGINCNLNDLSAAIGSAQLKKLPAIVSRRMTIGNTVRDALRSNPVVQVGWQVPESQASYWFLRMTVNSDALNVDKDAFCRALAAEGLDINPSYRHIPGEQPWFRNKKVFGNRGFPWDCSDYKGPKEPRANISNALRAVETNFNIAVHENYSEQDTADVIAAVEKVAAAYTR